MLLPVQISRLHSASEVLDWQDVWQRHTRSGAGACVTSQQNNLSRVTCHYVLCLPYCITRHTTFVVLSCPRTHRPRASRSKTSSRSRPETGSWLKAWCLATQVKNAFSWIFTHHHKRIIYMWAAMDAILGTWIELLNFINIYIVLERASETLSLSADDRLMFSRSADKKYHWTITLITRL